MASKRSERDLKRDKYRIRNGAGPSCHCYQCTATFYGKKRFAERDAHENRFHPVGIGQAPQEQDQPGA